jgi:hypothetical protein
MAWSRVRSKKYFYDKNMMKMIRHISEGKPFLEEKLQYTLNMWVPHNR